MLILFNNIKLYCFWQQKIEVFYKFMINKVKLTLLNDSNTSWKIFQFYIRDLMALAKIQVCQAHSLAPQVYAVSFTRYRSFGAWNELQLKKDQTRGGFQPSARKMWVIESRSYENRGVKSSTTEVFLRANKGNSYTISKYFFIFFCDIYKYLELPLIQKLPTNLKSLQTGSEKKYE